MTRRAIYTGKLAKRIPWTADQGVIRRARVEALTLLLKHYVPEKPDNPTDAFFGLAWGLACDHVPAFQVGPPRKNASDAWLRKAPMDLTPGERKKLKQYVRRWFSPVPPRRGAPRRLFTERDTPLLEQAPSLLLNNIEKLGSGSDTERLRVLLREDARAQDKPVTRHIARNLPKLQKRVSRARKQFR